MGLEALCICRVDDETAEAKALLESRELTTMRYAHMRALVGYRDSKSPAVSDAFSATRYSLG